MKINKYFLGLAVMVLGGLTSCNTDVEGPTYSTSLQSISFDAGAQDLVVAADEDEVTTPVLITRGVAAGEASISFTTEASEEGIFTNDAEDGVIKFAAGQNTAVINVTASNLQKEKTYTYVITLDPEVENTLDTIANPTQNKQIVISVTREGDWTEWKKWNSAGTASYFYSKVIFGPAEDSGLPFTYRQSLENPAKYQLKLDKWGYGVSLILNYDEETGIVSMPATYTGFTHPTYGPVNIGDYQAYYESQTGAAPANPIYGEFDKEQGIITIVTGYWDPDGPWGADYEYIYLDGYVRADLTSELTYVGVLTDAENQVFAMGNLTLGPDASEVKALVVEADADAEAVADALAAGEVEGVDVEAGLIQVPISEGLTGKLQLVVAVLNDGAVGSVSSVFFEYYGGGANPWQSLGTGYLTDNFFISNFLKEAETPWTPQTYEVEILENTETPGMFRIINAFEEAMKLLAGEEEDYTEFYEPSNMEVDATDPDGVYFLGQPVGYADQTISSYGGYLLSNGNDFDELKAEGLLGKLENGAITLPQIDYLENNEPTGYYYQGVRSTANGLRYAGWMDDGIEFKIVLPSASASVKAKAASKARASQFERNMHRFDMTKTVNRPLVKKVKAVKSPKAVKNFKGSLEFKLKK